LVAIAGFVYILFARPNFSRELFLAAAIILLGGLAFFLRSCNFRRADVSDE
jgi:hypothetical protein